MPYLKAALLAFAWCALTGSLTVANLVFGLILASIILYLVRDQVRAAPTRIRPLALLSLCWLFFYELALSGWRVARLVTRPRMELCPGIFAFPLKVDRDFEITLLANLITLTPGTLSVDVSEDRGFLFVHAIDCGDVDQAIRDIQQGFERKILEAFH